MMWYYGGAGWAGWLFMGLSMIVFWGALILLLLWAVRSFNRPRGAEVLWGAQHPPGASGQRRDHS